MGSPTTDQEDGVVDKSTGSSAVLTGKHCGPDGKWRKCRAQFCSARGILEIKFKKPRLWHVRKWKSSKAIVEQELCPNSHAVIYMRDKIPDKCLHTVAIVPLQAGTSAQTLVFSSQSETEVKNLCQKLQEFCNVASFKVEVESSSAFSGTAFLHICQTSIILTALKDSKVIHCGQWPIQDSSQLCECQNQCLLIKDIRNKTVTIIRTLEVAEIQGEFLKRLIPIPSGQISELMNNNLVQHKIQSQSYTTPSVADRLVLESVLDTSDMSFGVDSEERPSPPVPQRCPKITGKRYSGASTSSEYEDMENSSRTSFIPSSSTNLLNISDSESCEPPKRPPKRSVGNTCGSCKSTSDTQERTHFFVPPPKPHMTLKNRRHHSDSEMQICINTRTSESTVWKRHSSCSVMDYSSKFEKPELKPELSSSRDPPTPQNDRQLATRDTTARSSVNQPMVKSRCYVYTNLQERQYMNVMKVNSIRYVNWHPEAEEQVPERPPPKVPPRRPNPPVPPRRGQRLRSNERKPAIVLKPEQEQNPSIYVAVFASRPVAGRTWFLQVAFIYNDEATLELYQKLAKDSNHELKKVQVLEVKTDIQVVLQMLCSASEFELKGEETQDIDFESVKRLQKGGCFVIEFLVQHKTADQSHEFLGKIIVGPKDSSSCLLTNRLTMGINEVFERKQQSGPPPLQPNNTVQQSCQPRTCSRLPLTYAQQSQLCQKLDVTLHSNGNDWKLVASYLEFTMDEIEQLEDKSYKCHSFSPMKEILHTWQQRDPNCSMDRLLEILQKIERRDIVEDLNAYVSNDW